MASPARRFARRRRGVGRRRPGARACARRLSDGCAPRFAQRRGAPRRAVTAGRMHRWRGARVKLLTEATCLQDAVPPHLERYLLRGRFDVFSTYQCAVSRRTSTTGARDDELAVLESGEWTWQNGTRTSKNEQTLHVRPRFGAFRRRGETLAQEPGGRSILLVGMPAAHETGLPITTVRPYQSRNDSAGTAHLSYGSSKRSDSGAGSEHTAVTVDAIGLTTHRKCRSQGNQRATASEQGPRPSSRPHRQLPSKG